MKRFLFLIAVTLCGSLGAATLSPVQLLNPAGSTSGQAIVSNGASSAPTWGTIPASGLSQITANTVLGNPTASSAAPTAVGLPSCSTSASALLYTTNSGFSCNTAVNAAQLGGATFAAPGAIGGTTPGSGAFTTLSASGTFTPSQTSGIVGTTTNNNANAGSVGEYVTSSASAVSLTSGTAANITSISLTAGDWNVWGNVQFVPAGTTTQAQAIASVSTTSATHAAPPYMGIVSASIAAGLNQTAGAPMQRLSLSSTTTVYLVATGAFSVSTETASGVIQARRVR